MQWTALHGNAMQSIAEQCNAMECNVTQCHAKHNTNTHSHCRKDSSKRNVTRLHNTHHTKLNTNTHNHCDNEISEKMLFDCTTHNTQNITQIHKTITVMKFPKKMLLDYATQECSAIMSFSEELCNNDIWWTLIILRICHPVLWLRLSLWILVVRAEYRVCPL